MGFFSINVMENTPIKITENFWFHYFSFEEDSITKSGIWCPYLKCLIFSIDIHYFNNWTWTEPYTELCSHLYLLPTGRKAEALPSCYNTGNHWQQLSPCYPRRQPGQVTQFYFNLCQRTWLLQREVLTFLSYWHLVFPSVRRAELYLLCWRHLSALTLIPILFYQDGFYDATGVLSPYSQKIM